MFLTWLDLLPQMQAFEYRLFEKSCDKFCVTTFFGSLSNDVGKEKS